MPKLRVGFITTALYWGGAERWMLDLARLSVDRLNWGGVATMTNMNRDASMVRHFEKIMPIYEHGPEAVAKLLPRVDILLVWGRHNWQSLIRDFGKPVVFVGHGQGAFDRSAAKEAFPGATHFVAVAATAVTPIVAAGVPESRITVIHNGIDPQRCLQEQPREDIRRRLQVRDDQFLVGYVGRMAPEKNPSGVAQAVALCPPKYLAVFVGSGYDQARQRRKVRNILGDRALFVDKVEDVGSYYRAIDCFVSASPAEGFSMGMLEAMLCRTPCVLTNVGVLPELEQQFGRYWERVVPDTWDVSYRLAAAILRIARMPEHHLRLRLDQAEKLVRTHFTARQMADRWIDYLYEIADDPFWRLTTRAVETRFQSPEPKITFGNTMTVTEHLRAHLLDSLGYADPPVRVPDLPEILESECNTEFVRLMQNRLVVACFRYGQRNRPERWSYDFLQGLQKKLCAYRETGNTENLVDAANYCLLEFSHPSHPHAHFRAEDDHNHCPTIKS